MSLAGECECVGYRDNLVGICRDMTYASPCRSGTNVWLIQGI